MKVLVTGATGLIGCAVCARLAEEGHQVLAVVRPGSRPLPMGAVRVVEMDIARATGTQIWEQHLLGVEAVVNCVGVLQDSAREDVEGVHVTGAAALFRACEKIGVRRVIHFSAIGVDRAQPSAFSVSKLEGDHLLMERELDWVILRPSVVLGRNVFGASALIRGLSALPLGLSMGRTAPLQVVQLDDVAATVAFFMHPAAPSQVALELAGPERLTMDEVVARYREWHGWRPARRLTVPDRAANLLYRTGDLASLLGWRSPVRSTARKEIERGAIGNPRPWRSMTGIAPSSLSSALVREPASVQDRWFAKLYFLKPIIFLILPLFWIGTGIISLTAGYQQGIELMTRAGAASLASPGVVAGAITDILVGLAIAYRPTARQGLYAAIALSLFYIVAGSILLPSLWLQPLGPLMKIWPILALHLVALAIHGER
ncbi:SDR family oxidoreductase [Chelativorans sp. AA-79]|uniref:SDR family oxidoreductase n=1 Tax=Chelativorans sp. AA-79 TaxID=3028735 RepID=UPI0023FA3D66|nr:SDR family oxidoreductase [Chelativorans sp. AA-79]WEX09580.1 SDR family oxidoreductase [Chelativorans sp. AA-79]